MAERSANMRSFIGRAFGALTGTSARMQAGMTDAGTGTGTCTDMGGGSLAPQMSLDGAMGSLASFKIAPFPLPPPKSPQPTSSGSDVEMEDVESPVEEFSALTVSLAADNKTPPGSIGSLASAKSFNLKISPHGRDAELFTVDNRYTPEGEVHVAGGTQQSRCPFAASSTAMTKSPQERERHHDVRMELHRTSADMAARGGLRTSSREFTGANAEMSPSAASLNTSPCRTAQLPQHRQLEQTSPLSQTTPPSRATPAVGGVIEPLPFFVGSKSRSQTDTILENERDGIFLTRESGGFNVLSIRWRPHGVFHIRLNCDKDTSEWWADDNNSYATCAELVRCWTADIKGFYSLASIIGPAEAKLKGFTERKTITTSL